MYVLCIQIKLCHVNYISVFFVFTCFSIDVPEAGIILCMRPAKEKRRYILTWSLIGWAHTQNDLWSLSDVTDITSTLLNSYDYLISKTWIAQYTANGIDTSPVYECGFVLVHLYVLNNLDDT